MHQREVHKKEGEHGQIRNSGEDPLPQQKPGSPPHPVLLGRVEGRGSAVGLQTGLCRDWELLPSRCGPRSHALPAEKAFRGVPGHVKKNVVFTQTNSWGGGRGGGRAVPGPCCLFASSDLRSRATADRTPSPARHTHSGEGGLAHAESAPSWADVGKAYLPRAQ